MVPTRDTAQLHVASTSYGCVPSRRRMRPTWVVTQQPCPGAFAPTNRTPSRQSRSLTLAAGRGAIGGLLEDRVSADPRFLSKLSTEVSVNFSCSLLAEAVSRGENFDSQLPLVASDLFIGSTVCVVMMFLMAPVPDQGGSTESGMRRISRSISGRIRKIQKDTEEGARGALKRLNRQLNRLPTYAFDNHQSYTVAERVGSVAYNGARFASLGLLGGSVGQFITDILTGVLATRNQPARVPPPTAPLVDFPDATLPVPDVPVELVVDPTVVAAAAGPQASSQATSVAMSVAASVADSVAPSASIRLASSSLQLSNIVDAVPFDADLMGPAQMELSAMDVPDPALLAAMGLFPSQPRSLVPGIAPESSLLDAFRAAAAAEASADVVAGPGAESAPTVLDYLTSMAEPVARVPAIVTTAAAWAVFLGVSSNVRYQLVCGVEQWLEQGPFSGRPKALGAVMTVLRLGNNVLGGFQYVQIAEFVRATMR